MFREKTFKFLFRGGVIFVLIIGLSPPVVSQTNNSIKEVNYNELLDLLFDPNRAADEDINNFYSIQSKFDTQELKEFNKVLLKRNLEAQLKEMQTNKWVLISEEQIVNSIYNQGLYYEILLKYSLDKFQKPYNKIPMEEQMKLGEKVFEDSVYRSRKRDVCGVNSGVE